MGVPFQPIPDCGSGGSFASAVCKAVAWSGPQVGDGGAAGGGAAAGDCATGDGAADGGAVTVTVVGVGFWVVNAVISATKHTANVRFRRTTIAVFHARQTPIVGFDGSAPAPR